MQIYEMSAAERPREKLMLTGAGTLSNSELLALIIRTGTGDKSAIQLAEEVLAYADASSGGLGYSDARELTRISGIGESKACAIIAAMELSKRLMPGSCLREGRGRISSPEDVAGILMDEMMYERREKFISLHLNTRLQLEYKHVVAVGNLDCVPVNPRDVLGLAVRRGAASVLVAHNHPTGDPTPSRPDIDLTERLVNASSIMGIKLLDHVIFGNGRLLSMRDEGYIA